MSANANTTVNGTQLEWNCYYIYNASATKIGASLIYCLMFVVSMVGNIFIGIVVYKTKNMRKPINFLIVNMAMSDLLFPIFLFPRIVTRLYVDSWLISGSLGQALCKLLTFLADTSASVSIQSLVLIAVFFSDKCSREDSLDMPYEESQSGQDNLRNISQRSDMGIQRMKNDSKKRRNHIFAEIPLYTPFRPFFEALL